MKMGKKILAALLASAMFASCAMGSSTAQELQNTLLGQTSETPQATEQAAITASDVVLLTLSADDEFSNKDTETGNVFDEVSTITLKDGASTSDSSAVDIDGDCITITAEGTYTLSGTLSDGQIVVQAPEDAKVQLVLNGVSITNDSTAAIYVAQADKVFITTASGTQNSISATCVEDADAETNIDAAIFSKEDLTLNGLGTLTIQSNDNGIVSKDDLVFTSGTYDITADAHGLEANNSIRIADGTFTITSGKDALHAAHDEDATLGYIYIVDGVFKLDVQGDGLDASAQINIEGGSFTITAAGGSENATSSTSSSSMFGQNFMMGRTSQQSTQGQTTQEDTSTSTKGIKADTVLSIYGGEFIIDAASDALHSNVDLVIYDGVFYIKAGDDAITADAATTILDGDITIAYCYEGIEGQTVDIYGGDIDITSYDDGINASVGTSAGNSTVYISIAGGNIVIDAYDEGDGLDANGSIYISGGSILISGTTTVTDTPLDYEDEAIITGGVFLTSGSNSQTTQNFGEDSTQCSIFVELNSTQNGTVTLTDSSGNVMASYEPTKNYQVVHISTPELEVGETYTLTTGNVTQTITLDSIIYGEGQESGMMSQMQGMTGQMTNRR